MQQTLEGPCSAVSKASKPIFNPQFCSIFYICKNYALLHRSKFKMFAKVHSCFNFSQRMNKYLSHVAKFDDCWPYFVKMLSMFCQIVWLLDMFDKFHVLTVIEFQFWQMLVKCGRLFATFVKIPLNNVFEHYYLYSWFRAQTESRALRTQLSSKKSEKNRLPRSSWDWQWYEVSAISFCLKSFNVQDVVQAFA